MFIADCVQKRNIINLAEKLYITDTEDSICEYLRVYDIKDYLKQNPTAICNCDFTMVDGVVPSLTVSPITNYMRIMVKDIECFYKYNEIWMFYDENRYVHIETDRQYFRVSGNTLDYGNGFGVPHMENWGLCINIYFGTARERQYDIRDRDILIEAGIRSKFRKNVVLG